MNRDLNAIAVALNAKIEYLAESIPGDETEILRFRDSRLRYELHLQPKSDTEMLAIDPSEPIQACPMLEYSFCCTNIEIGPSAYSVDGNELAIRFYDGGISESTHRLTMTWVSDSYWYIWANSNAKPYAGDGV